MDYAVQAQNPTPALIFHTDLGTQNTSETFQEKLKKHEMIPSFSRKGCPYNNACIESFQPT
ncbi:DDE-type integrase/transposase/recombinase [Lysinibacillus sp. HST-98]|nr:DDE-type integrase/transposase/recombinase [Lysinibacillus sp. HST-98]